MVDFAEPVEGNELADPYTGTVTFNATSASAPGLPDSAHTTLAAGTPVTIPVTVTNNGPEPEDFFVDPRLDTDTSLTLAPLTASTVSLPPTNEPEWVVPTETSGILVSQSSTVPAMFDFGTAPGDPDLWSTSGTAGGLCADTETGSYSPTGGTLSQGIWFADPSECGPYPAAAPAGTATITGTVTTRAFDPAVTSTTGDLWTTASTGAFTDTPIVIGPGASATINVTITPSAAAGTVVKGTLYVDDELAAIPPYSDISGDELSALPYEYTVG